MRSNFYRPQYKHVAGFVLLFCGSILVCTLIRFSAVDYPIPHTNFVSLYNLNPHSGRSFLKTDYHNLLLWSSDFHISPIADIKNIVEDYRVKVIDKSLSGHCHLSHSCQKDLRILTQQNGIALGGCPNCLRRDFYDSYRNDNEMKTVSAFLCLHATSMCELFMPFNRSLIVIASTRWVNDDKAGNEAQLMIFWWYILDEVLIFVLFYCKFVWILIWIWIFLNIFLNLFSFRYEIGRHRKSQWEKWNDNLRLISQSPYNVIAANNKYDQVRFNILFFLFFLRNFLVYSPFSFVFIVILILLLLFAAVILIFIR